MDRSNSRWLHGPVAMAMVTLWALAVSAQDRQDFSGQILRIEEPAQIIQFQQLLERRDLDASEVTITDLEGRVIIRESLAPRPEIEAATIESSSRLDAQFIVREPGIQSMRLVPESIDLPSGVAVPRPAESGSGATDGWFHPRLTASPTPAIWDETLRRYRMRLSLGLRSENLPADASLEQPITVQFGFRGLVAEPIEAIRLEQAGTEHEIHLDFHFLPTAAQPVLELRSAITDIDFQLEAMPRIELRPVRDAMVGLGLDEVQVRVLRLAPHGAPDNTLDRLSATIEVIAGSAVPEPADLIFLEGEAQTHFTLRSRGLDDATIRVTAGAHSATHTIQQGFPTGPLVAALLGGIVGGFSRRFARNADGGSTSARIAEGLAVAVVAYVAGVLGVGYLGLPSAVVATEAGAFLTGALTGFVGVTVIEALSKRLSPGS